MLRCLLATVFALFASSAQAQEPSLYPQPIILFNYGTYTGTPPGTPAPQTAVASPTPTPATATATEAEIAPAVEPEKPRNYENGFGLTVLAGIVDTQSLPLSLGLEADFRFLDYLGVELQTNATEERYGAFAGPKVQIPFKSKFINFTPAAGVGFAIQDIGPRTQKSFAFFLRGEVELVNVVIVRLSILEAESRRDSSSDMYDSCYNCGTSQDTFVPDSTSKKDKMTVISLRGGVKLSPGFSVLLDHTEREYRGLRNDNLTSLVLDFKF